MVSKCGHFQSPPTPVGTDYLQPGASLKKKSSAPEGESLYTSRGAGTGRRLFGVNDAYIHTYEVQQIVARFDPAMAAH